VPRPRTEISKKIFGGAEICADEKIRGGFVVKNENAEINCTFENLIFSEYFEELVQFLIKNLNLQK